MKILSTGILYAIWALVAVSPSAAQMRVMNGASFDPSQPIAPGSFATISGQNLCSQTMAGDWIAPMQLLTTLGGCTVTVNGAVAMMQDVSAGQINFIMPMCLSSGTATIVVNNGSQATTGAATIGNAGPGTFSLHSMGREKARCSMAPCGKWAPSAALDVIRELLAEFR